MEVLLNLNRLILLFIFVISVTLFFYVYSKKNRSPKMVGFLLFSTFSFSLWILCFLFILFAPNHFFILFFERFAVSIFAFLAFLWVYFSFVFPEGMVTGKISLLERVLIASPALFFTSASLFTNWIIKDLVLSPYSFSLPLPSFGMMYYSYVFYLVVYFMWGMINLALKFFKSEKIEKLQILYVLFGTAIAFLGGFLIKLVIPVAGVYDLHVIEPLFVLVALFFISYAVVNSQFLDIEDFLLKGFGIVFAIGLLVATFFSLVAVNFSFLLTFYIIAIDLFFVFSILLKNWRGTSNRSFALFALSVAIWTFSIYMYGIASDPLDALFWIRVSLYSASFLPVLFVCFARVFPREEEINVWEWTTLFVPAITFAMLSFSQLLIVDVNTRPWGYNLVLGKWFVLFAFYFIVSVIYALHLLLKKYFNSSGVIHLQIGYLFLGFSLGFVFTCITNIVLPLIGISSFVILGPYFTLIPIVFLAYVIGRYKFMGLELALRRGTTYAFVTMLMFGFYVLAGFVAECFFRRALGSNSILISIFFAVFIALVYQPLTILFFNLSNRFFVISRYDYRSILHRVTSTVTGKTELKDLLRFIVSILFESMGCAKISLLMPDKTRKKYVSVPMELDKWENFYKNIEIEKSGSIVKWLEDYKRILSLEELEDRILRNQSFASEFGKGKDFFLDLRDSMKNLEIEVFVPIIYKNEFKGIIALGHKLSNELYTSEDLSLLHNIEGQVAIALENIMLHEENAALKTEIGRKGLN
ncbi:hypothetical protein A2230_04955 [candidate division WOR-1 bacterium RIFOXYA2_FULL_36_21]|uniref:Histidine kinase N-terminal 7TM region domain-containing protein n=1 Tax=candidate division WOR-1 bacterium RIFOXYB2_FULL_36_35 TaxID=1802578 RepID=A0A1F4S5P7_UNCSA|nr:MAG: hypothetical protein A2230_04955 [candidate division WOR-1 bacterium RIFOXYA2_FULL_36_21]OGC15754.1 MAG: hypothetical protein A2290_05380 [candidate division WOR-1 bacterium RIFOXYB2_FULL_36_35]OGC21109.1 MAG: hypothetical protein A2282_03710 [candidate division WOR-1 bacterium RIFOXYA12_FULL_36_13]